MRESKNKKPETLEIKSEELEIKSELLDFFTDCKKEIEPMNLTETPYEISVYGTIFASTLNEFIESETESLEKTNKLVKFLIEDLSTKNMGSIDLEEINRISDNIYKLGVMTQDLCIRTQNLNKIHELMGQLTVNTSYFDRCKIMRELFSLVNL